MTLQQLVYYCNENDIDWNKEIEFRILDGRLSMKAKLNDLYCDDQCLIIEIKE
jgi:hypothetical protein